MTGNNRPFVISCLVIGVIICLCVGALAAAGVSAYFFGPMRSITMPGDTNGDPVIPPSGEEGRPSPDTQSQVERQMDEIERQVSALRGLDRIEDVSRSLMTREELRQRMVEDFNEDYSLEEAREDVIELYALGLVERDFDIYNLMVDLYSEQVAGFYDFDEKAMYIIQGAGFHGPERLTYAHEFVHALQDQHYQISEGLNYTDEMCELDSEHCAAVQALLEGDASLSELQWFQSHSTNTDRRELQDYYSNNQSPVFDEAPPFMQESLLFPYIQGGEFVEYLYGQGGWEAVDAAYANLPTSTEQIMHPERYPTDVPVAVELPDLLPVLGEGWQEISRNVLGELYTYLILAYGIDPNARLEDTQARAAAEGWGGDTYVVYYNDQSDEIILVLQAVWDDESEAQEFAGSFVNHSDLRFGSAAASQSSSWVWQNNQSFTQFVLAGDQTTWVFAPTAEIGGQILEEIGTQ